MAILALCVLLFETAFALFSGGDWRAAALGALYPSFTLPDALDSLVGWLEDRFGDEQYEDLAGIRSTAEAEKWREVAPVVFMAASYE